MDPSLHLTDMIDKDIEAFLESGLSANAKKNGAPAYEKKDLSVVYRDESGKIRAGLTGKTFWNWLYIDMIFVDDSMRNQGIARQLIQTAEAEALIRGCHSAYLWTENYEGKTFYPKVGFQEFVVKKDFPVGFTRTGFMKRIAA